MLGLGRPPPRRPSRPPVRDERRKNIPAAFEPPPTQATTQSGSRPSLLEALAARFAADDRLEVAHDHGKRVRTDDAADRVMGRAATSPSSRGWLRWWRPAASCEPVVTATTFAPNVLMLKTLSFWRRMSSSPM